MSGYNNLLGGAFVKRQIQPKVQTQTTVPSTEYYDEVYYDLPFYYTLDLRFCIFLIILGVLVGVLQFVLTGTLFYLPFARKKYICTRCKSTYKRFKKLKICPKCYGKVIPGKEYLEKSEILERFKQQQNNNPKKL